jgi:four helix bundle protein
LLVEENGGLMQDFRKLQVWEKAHQFTITLYAVTQQFPREELYGLVSQMRRCSVSIPSNLAEGCGRNSSAELARFSEIAMGSASELEYQLLLSCDLGYLDYATYERLDHDLNDVKRMLNRFIQRLRQTNNDSS